MCCLTEVIRAAHYDSNRRVKSLHPPRWAERSIVGWFGHRQTDADGMKGSRQRSLHGQAIPASDPQWDGEGGPAGSEDAGRAILFFRERNVPPTATSLRLLDLGRVANRNPPLFLLNKNYRISTDFADERNFFGSVSASTPFS